MLAEVFPFSFETVIETRVKAIAYAFDRRVITIPVPDHSARTVRRDRFDAHLLARAGLGDRASVKLRDYRDVGTESFDKIVSVGMFEHVGQKQLPEYFAQAYRSLKPGGLFLNHDISRRAPRLHHRTEAIELAGEVVYRTWRLYMAVMAYGFTCGRF
ncbi:MAG: hypothetical protein FOGNACKC_03338 [Anaerolineae bacterium]|nr:hypothetical protein [Anaerolineae bacterium]